MAHLLDTNILLRLFSENDPHFGIVRSAVEKLEEESGGLYTSPQNIAEFWNVTTRPLDRNGFGFSPEEANLLVERLTGILDVLPDTSSIYLYWLRLVRQARVSGVQVHDARLVAWMQAHDIHSLLTLNQGDFVRYEGLYEFTVLTPQDVAGK